MKIVILGGTSGFGRWLAQQAKEFSKKYNLNLDIWITGRNLEKGKKVAQELGVNFSNSNIEAVKDADIVIVAVTIGNTKKVINEVGPYLKKGCVFADVTSVKKMPYEEMLKYKDKALILPTHPMFGPYVKDIAGQVVVLTPPDETKKDYRYLRLKEFLTNQGAKVFEISPDIHDKVMSVVQGLTHFSLFVVGESLSRILKQRFGAKKSGQQEMEFIENFTSPVYKMLTSLVGRYMGQNPWLYAEIQINNEENKFVQETFIDVAQKFNQYFFQDNKPEKFVEIVEKGKRFFGDYTEKGQKYTDKIIYLLAQQIRKLKDKIGQQITIQNIYTGETITGLLEDFENNQLKISGQYYDFDEWILI